MRKEAEMQTLEKIIQALSEKDAEIARLAYQLGIEKGIGLCTVNTGEELPPEYLNDGRV